MNVSSRREEPTLHKTKPEVEPHMAWFDATDTSKIPKGEPLLVKNQANVVYMATYGDVVENAWAMYCPIKVPLQGIKLWGFIPD